MKLTILATTNKLFKFSLSYLPDGDYPPEYETLMQILAEQLRKHRLISLVTASTDTEIIISLTNDNRPARLANFIRKIFHIHTKPWWTDFKAAIEKELKINFAKVGQIFFDELPIDVVVATGEFLDLVDRNGLACVSKQTYPAVLNPLELLKRHFPNKEKFAFDESSALTLFRKSFLRDYAKISPNDAQLFTWSKEGSPKLLNFYSDSNYHLFKIVDSNKQNILFWLAHNGHQRLLDELFIRQILPPFLNFNGILISKRCTYGLTILDWAIMSFQSEATLRKFFELIDPVTVRPLNGGNANETWTYGPVHYAARQGNLTALKFLLELIPGLINDRAPFNETPLQIAIAHGQLNIVNFLLQHPDTDLLAQNSYGETIWFYAAKRGDIEIVNAVYAMLRDNSEWLSLANDKHDTPLMMAAKFGHDKVVKLIASLAHEDVNRIDRINKFTALHYAVNENHIECVRALCLHPNLNINLVSILGYSPLMMAHRFEYQEMIELLENKFSAQSFQEKFYALKSLITENALSHQRILGPKKLLSLGLNSIVEQEPENELNAETCYNQVIWLLTKISKANGNPNPMQFFAPNKEIPISPLFNTILAVPRADLNPAEEKPHPQRCLPRF